MSKTPNKRSQFMGDSPLFYKEPINLESGEGVWLYDKSGKKYSHTSSTLGHFGVL
jgi:4-aminobutyrate aminotransferase-like enzyme